MMILAWPLPGRCHRRTCRHATSSIRRWLPISMEYRY